MRRTQYLVQNPSKLVLRALALYLLLDFIFIWDCIWILGGHETARVPRSCLPYWLFLDETIWMVNGPSYCYSIGVVEGLLGAPSRSILIISRIPKHTSLRSSKNTTSRFACGVSYSNNLFATEFWIWGSQSVYITAVAYFHWGCQRRLFDQTQGWVTLAVCVFVCSQPCRKAQFWIRWDLWQPGLAVLDVTNPHARRWYSAKLSALIDLGVDAFKVSDWKIQASFGLVDQAIF